MSEYIKVQEVPSDDRAIRGLGLDTEKYNPSDFIESLRKINGINLGILNVLESNNNDEGLKTSLLVLGKLYSSVDELFGNKNVSDEVKSKLFKIVIGDEENPLKIKEHFSKWVTNVSGVLEANRVWNKSKRSNSSSAGIAKGQDSSLNFYEQIGKQIQKDEGSQVLLMITLAMEGVLDDIGSHTKIKIGEVRYTNKGQIVIAYKVGKKYIGFAYGDDGILNLFDENDTQIVSQNVKHVGVEVSGDTADKNAHRVNYIGVASTQPLPVEQVQPKQPPTESIAQTAKKTRLGRIWEGIVHLLSRKNRAKKKM